jgi:hypothetical protein
VRPIVEGLFMTGISIINTENFVVHVTHWVPVKNTKIRVDIMDFENQPHELTAKFGGV